MSPLLLPESPLLQSQSPQGGDCFDLSQWNQRCLVAEEQVVHVREELAVVGGRLNTLQHRHELEMTEKVYY